MTPTLPEALARVELRLKLMLPPYDSDVRILLAEAHRAQRLREALTLAKEATNGWACYAKRNIEHEEIARLHREIARLTALLETP